MQKLLILFTLMNMTTLPIHSQIEGKSMPYAEVLEDKPLVVILLGPPGAGKGTHAKPLQERLDLPHISTGDLLRGHISEGSTLGKKAKDYINQGKLVPDELVLDMLFSRVEERDCYKGFILDGFPRTLYQAKALDQKLAEKAHVVVLHFKITDNFLVERISGRLTCKNCNAVYHTKYNPPKETTICDHCSHPLIHRKDDTEKVIKERLKVYHEQTKPLISYYDAKEVLYDINSQKSQREVFEDLTQTIDAYLSSHYQEEVAVKK